MELVQSNNAACFPVTGPTAPAAVTFISELLTMTLVGQNGEVIIEPQEFLFDSEPGINTTGSLRIEVTGEEVIETDKKTELTLSGTVENDLEQRQTFFLHFGMWRDRSVAVSGRNDCSKTPGTNSLLIRFENITEQLPDSVFELDLFQKDLTGQTYASGKGRGYLVLDNKLQD